MKSWKKPTDDLVKKALESVKTEADRQYFFSRLKNPHWIQPLENRGFFKHPPKVKQLPDGYVQYPFWPEFQFLKNIADETADQVVKIILGIPKTDNSRFYDDVIDIALKVEASLSIKLKEKILEYVEDKYLYYSYSRFEKVLCYWASNNQTESALELTKALVAFQKDPQASDKQERRKKNPEDWKTSLEPHSRFNEWEYGQILEKGVRPLTELEPYATTQILIDATTTMIHYTLHQDHLKKGDSKDYSIIWCPRVNEPSSKIIRTQESLVHTLTSACEKVYEKAPESVTELDQVLRNQRWDIFMRIRQHLYASHLNEQTKPWIREMILAHEDYNTWEHHFEFQRMIRRACENFGADLLAINEREQIFKAILSGPSEQNFQEWVGDRFTKELFEKRKRRFHRMQLSPFSPVLFRKYADYFQELKAEEEKLIVDDDYVPYKSEGARRVERRSPKQAEELANMPDEEILSFLNEWENAHYNLEKAVDTNFEALSQAFQSVFKEVILPDESRLNFWINNREQIERPIYVRAIVSAIHEHVKLKQFDHLDQWFDFCEWVLSHLDQAKEEGVNCSDESREHPDWSSSRRAVGDFIGMCLKEDVDVPISSRDHLASLLDKLCTQYDRQLDDDEPIFLNQDNQLAEAINNTRSRTLKNLVDFGYWARRQLKNDQADTPEVFTILDKRLGSECERALKVPEYALLGLDYGRIFNLNREWATQHKSDFFPQENPRAWAKAFGNFLLYNRPYKPIFEVSQNDIEFALKNFDEFKVGSGAARNPADALGEHLFRYYLWKAYPLTGTNSLLERFYETTREEKGYWARLFSYVGQTLENSNKQLEENLAQRCIEFFDWRLKKKEPLELKKFTFWLTAECLDEEWRLKSYSKVLDVCRSKNTRIIIQVDALRNMLEYHTALVMECFAKLTASAVGNGDAIYILADEARPILRAGLASDDDTVKANAERARENLLRGGRFDFLDEEENPDDH